MDRLCAISVDLDSMPHYCRIHGLDDALLGDAARDVVGAVAIPRLLELFDRAGVGATFFVIGADLGQGSLDAALVRAQAAGVELASHSFSHDYRLSRWSRAAIDADLAKAHEAITRVAGRPPKGFRAPGYTLSPTLLQAVAARGYAWDSSIFPSAPYYLAKASVMAALAVARRPSSSVLDGPGVLLAPRQPYTPSLERPWRRGEAPLLELPVAVSPRTRLPFIGTFVTTAPRPLMETVFRTLRRDALLNLELHAIDVLDESDGLPAALARQQRDLKVPVREKLERLGRLFSWLADDRDCVTVTDVARRWRNRPEQRAR